MSSLKIEMNPSLFPPVNSLLQVEFEAAFYRPDEGALADFVCLFLFLKLGLCSPGWPGTHWQPSLGP